VHREGVNTVRKVRSAEIAPRVGCGIAWVAGAKTAAPPPPDDLRSFSRPPGNHLPLEIIYVKGIAGEDVIQVSPVRQSRVDYDSGSTVSPDWSIEWLIEGARRVGQRPIGVVSCFFAINSTTPFVFVFLSRTATEMKPLIRFR